MCVSAGVIDGEMWESMLSELLSGSEEYTVDIKQAPGYMFASMCAG